AGRPAPAPLAPASRPAPAEITAAVIQRVIGGGGRAFRACYERELLDQPALAVRLVLAFTIAPDGSVTGARVESGAGNARLESCLLRALERLAFPPPSDGQPVTVSFPFQFQPAR
ncbi:MAG TPA: AgmX/PglI C-terminal domain-containing protein, partial [Polyangia bacterium]